MVNMKPVMTPVAHAMQKAAAAPAKHEAPKIAQAAAHAPAAKPPGVGKRLDHHA